MNEDRLLEGDQSNISVYTIVFYAYIFIMVKNGSTSCLLCLCACLSLWMFICWNVFISLAAVSKSDYAFELGDLKCTHFKWKRKIGGWFQVTQLETWWHIMKANFLILHWDGKKHLSLDIIDHCIWVFHRTIDGKALKNLWVYTSSEYIADPHQCLKYSWFLLGMMVGFCFLIFWIYIDFYIYHCQCFCWRWTWRSNGVVWGSILLGAHTVFSKHSLLQIGGKLEKQGRTSSLYLC